MSPGILKKLTTTGIMSLTLPAVLLKAEDNLTQVQAAVQENPSAGQSAVVPTVPLASYSQRGSNSLTGRSSRAPMTFAPESSGGMNLLRSVPPVQQGASVKVSPADTGLTTVRRQAFGETADGARPVPRYNDLQQKAPRALAAMREVDIPEFTHVELGQKDFFFQFGAAFRADVVVNTAKENNEAQFSMVKLTSPESTRRVYTSILDPTANFAVLSLDVFHPTSLGNSRGVFEATLDQSGDGSIELGIRNLYGQLSGLLFGNTSTAFMDVDIIPPTLNDQGPTGIIFLYQPTIQYIWTVNDQFNLTTSIEAPATLVTSNNAFVPPPPGDPIPDFQGVSHVPDFALKARWLPTDRGHLQLAGLARCLGAENVSGNLHNTAFGWGLHLSGRTAVTDRCDRPNDVAAFSAVYGEGIGRYNNEVAKLEYADAYWDVSPAQSKLKPLPMQSYMAGYSHFWTNRVYSTVAATHLELDTTVMNDPGAFRRGDYASVNLMFVTTAFVLQRDGTLSTDEDRVAQLLYGAEVQYGRREDYDGQKSDDVRLVFSLQLKK